MGSSSRHIVKVYTDFEEVPYLLNGLGEGGGAKQRELDRLENFVRLGEVFTPPG
jgi:hypothetical protein